MQAGILEDFEFSKWWKTFDFPIEMSKLTSNIFKKSTCSGQVLKAVQFLFGIP